MRAHRPSPAMVVALIALFVALGGTGYAAATGSIDSREIKNNSIQGKDVKDKSLTAKDFKGNVRGPAGRGDAGAPGQPGATGSQGNAGPQGGTGASGATSVRVRRSTVDLDAGSSASTVAQCDPGERATGGGVNPEIVTADATVIRTYPSTGDLSQAPAGETPTAWGGFAENPTVIDGVLTVHVICAAP